MTKALVVFAALIILPSPVDAKCASPNACLCVAERDSDAALRVLPSSVSVGFVNVSEVLRPGDCDFSVGDTIDVSSENDDDAAFASYPELIIALDCNANLQSFIVLDDESATCPNDTFETGRDDALALNVSEECLSDVHDVAPNPPCNDTEDGCSTVQSHNLVASLLVLGLVGFRRRKKRKSPSISRG